MGIEADHLDFVPKYGEIKRVEMVANGLFGAVEGEECIKGFRPSHVLVDGLTTWYGNSIKWGYQKGWIPTDKAFSGRDKKHGVESRHQVKVLPGWEASYGYVRARQEGAEVMAGLLPGEADELWIGARDGGVKFKILNSLATNGYGVVNLYYSDKPEGMTEYAQLLESRRKKEKIETKRGRIGWFTWPSKGQDMSEKWILSQLAMLKQSGVEMVVIDDGWQECYGKWIPNELFKHLTNLAKEIRDMGMKPGIWAALLAVTPSTETYREMEEKGWLLQKEGQTVDLSKLVPHGMAALDISIPEVEEFVLAQLDYLIEMGFEVFKLDYWNWAEVGDHKDMDETYTQKLDKLMRRIWQKFREHKEKTKVELELMACGQMLTLSKWTQYQRGCDDPETQDVEGGLGKLKNLAHYFNTRQLKLIFNGLKYVPGLEGKIIDKFGVTIDEGIKMVERDYGQVQGYFEGKYRGNLISLPYRSVYNPQGSVVEIRVPEKGINGLRCHVIDEVNNGVLAATDLIGSAWIGNDYTKLDKAGLEWLTNFNSRFKELSCAY